MKVGGKRRIIVPNSIGYTDFRVGPVATEPSDRRKLDKYVERLNDGKGELVFDLELVMVADDENDQVSRETVELYEWNYVCLHVLYRNLSKIVVAIEQCNTQMQYTYKIITRISLPPAPSVFT